MVRLARLLRTSALVSDHALSATDDASNALLVRPRNKGQLTA
jgi:hypothetical protein